MSAQAVVAAATGLRDLILGAGLPIPLADSLLQAATRLEAAAEGGECPGCAVRRENAIAALRATIAAGLARGAGQGSHELATGIAEAILDARLVTS